jgi:hypothetical protein
LLLPASLAGPWPPDPPRCCVDLQRITTIASRFVWLPGSACALLPFGLDPGVFAMAACRAIARPVCSPLMALRSPSRTSTSSPSVPLARLTTAVRSTRPAPWGFPAPPTLPARGIRVPAGPAAPRMTPLRLGSDLAAGFHARVVRLRRSSRPWRFAPPRARWCVSTTHAHGVWLPFPSPKRGGWFPFSRLPAGAAPFPTEVGSVPAPPLPPPEGAGSGSRLPSASPGPSVPRPPGELR